MFRIFEGKYEVVGTVVIPTVAIFALVLLPFLDRGRSERRKRERS